LDFLWLAAKLLYYLVINNSRNKVYALGRVIVVVWSRAVVVFWCWVVLQRAWRDLRK
jgi:hypothetical protein